MIRYSLQSAFLSQGWARDVIVSVSDEGFITGIHAAPAAEPPAGAERIDGIVVPGMPNAHSHAFQRAMAGNTEYRLSARDSFWTWRRAMYALANRIEPDDLQILATQLFVVPRSMPKVVIFPHLHSFRSS